MFSSIKSFWESITKSDDQKSEQSTEVQTQSQTEPTNTNKVNHSVLDNDLKTVVLEPPSESCESSEEDSVSDFSNNCSTPPLPPPLPKLSIISDSSFSTDDLSFEIPPAPPAPPTIRINGITLTKELQNTDRSFEIPSPPPFPVPAPPTIRIETSSEKLLPTVPSSLTDSEISDISEESFSDSLIPIINFEIPKLVPIEIEECENVYQRFEQSIIETVPSRAVKINTENQNFLCGFTSEEVESYKYELLRSFNSQELRGSNEELKPLLQNILKVDDRDEDSTEYIESESYEEIDIPLQLSSEADCDDIDFDEHTSAQKRLMTLHYTWVVNNKTEFEKPKNVFFWNFPLIHDMYKVFIEEVNSVPEFWYNKHIRQDIKQAINCAYVNTYKTWAYENGKIKLD